MSNIKDIFSNNQRIIILQGIEKSTILSNEMAQHLLLLYGYSLALKEVNILVKWLETRQLIIVKKLNESLWTMNLTSHGFDVVKGYVKEDGIAPPLKD